MIGYSYINVKFNTLFEVSDSEYDYILSNSRLEGYDNMLELVNELADDPTTGSYYSEDIPNLYITDDMSVLERVDDIIYDFLPVDNGVYNIEGEVELAFKYEIDYLYDMRDNVIGYDTYSAEVKFDRSSSKLHNFICKKVY